MNHKAIKKHIEDCSKCKEFIWKHFTLGFD